VSVGRRPKRTTLRQIGELHFRASVKSTDAANGICATCFGRPDASKRILLARSSHIDRRVEIARPGFAVRLCASQDSGLLSEDLSISA